MLLYPSNERTHQDLGVRAYALSPNEDPANLKAGRLLPVRTNEEWDMIEEVLNTFMPPR